jgi:hypothetical protein
MEREREALVILERFCSACRLLPLSLSVFELKPSNQLNDEPSDSLRNKKSKREVLDYHPAAF